MDDPFLYNPYSIKRAPPAHVPSNRSSKKVYKVDVAETMAKDIYISWATKANGIDACYIKPIKQYYNEHAVEKDLLTEWKIAGIVPRRDPKSPGLNRRLPGCKNASWPFEAFISIAENDDETGEWIGRLIASKLTSFCIMAKAEKGLRLKCQHEFAFRRVVSTDELLPVIHYLLGKHKLISRFGHIPLSIMSQAFHSCETRDHTCCEMCHVVSLLGMFQSANKF